MGRKTPYSDRTDLERLASSWIKLDGFLARGEWSAAVVRAATAAEIAANIAVRQELETKRALEKAFVDSLLRWANGLDGKLTRLMSQLPMAKDQKPVIRAAKATSAKINKKRNEVVHSGHFMNEEEATEVRAQARSFIDSLVGLYHADYSVEAAAAKYKTRKT